MLVSGIQQRDSKIYIYLYTLAIKLFKEMFGFAGWSFLTNSTYIMNTQGVNMGGFYIRTLKSGEPAPTGTVTINDFSDDNSKSSVIAAPSKGSAPYILCLPYTYQVDNYPTNGKRSTLVWAWPKELCTICSATYKNGKYTGTDGGAYYRFGDWVGNYTSNKDWYKIRTNGMTVELWELSSENINHRFQGTI